MSSITFKDGTLTQTVVNNGYSDISRLNLGTVRILGVPRSVVGVLVNGVAHTDFEVLESNEVRVNNLTVPVNSRYTITLTYSSDSSSSAHSLLGHNFVLLAIVLLCSLNRFLL